MTTTCLILLKGIDSLRPIQLVQIEWAGVHHISSPYLVLAIE
jgi:hypothetical protein